MMDTDAVGSLPTVREPALTVQQAEKVVGRSVGYIKGAAFLSTLERWMGEERFQRGLRAYIREYAWKNVTTDDFVASMEKASGLQLTAIARAFLDQPGVPIVDVEQKCANGRFDSIVIQQESLRLGVSNKYEPPAPWPIPICFAPPASSSAACTNMTSQRAAIAFPSTASCPSWVDPNPHLAGYYRYAVTKQQIELAQSVAAQLAPEAKLGLLSNAWVAVRRHRLTPDAILRLLPAFDAETNHEIVEKITSILFSIHEFVDDASEPSFKAYCAARMSSRKASSGLDGPLARDLARKKRNTEDDNVVLSRPAAMMLLGFAGDKAVRAVARDIVLQWLNDVTSRSIPTLERRRSKWQS